MQVKPEKNVLLYNILYTVFKRQRLIIITAAVTFVLIVFGTWLTTPVWDGVTKVLIRNQSQQNLALFNDLNVPVRDNPKINPGANLIQVLYSRDFAEDVVRTFKLDERLEKQKNNPDKLRFKVRNGLMNILKSPVNLAQALHILSGRPENYFEDAVEDLMEDAEKFELEQSSQVISVTVEEQDPVLSSKIANYMAEALVAKSKEMDMSNSKRALAFSKEKLGEAEKDLRESEEELLDFTKKANIVDIASEKRTKLEQISRTENELSTVTTGLAEAKARIRSYTDQVSEQRKLITASTLVASSPTVAQLKEGLNTLEANLAGAKARLASLEKEIEDQKGTISPSTVVSSSTVVAGLKDRLSALELQLAAAKENFAPESKKVKELQAQIETNKKLLQDEMTEILKSDSSVLNSISKDLAGQLVETMASVTSLDAQIDANAKLLEKEMAELLKNELAVLNSIHSNLPLDYVQTMAKVVSLEARQRVLEDLLDRFKKEGQDLAAKEIEYERLSRTVEAKRDLYTNLLSKYTQLEVQSVSDVGGYDLQIIDRANLPADAKQDWPLWVLNIPLGLIASILLGLGGAFFTEYWVENFRSARDVEERVGIHVLCTLPDIPPKRLHRF